MNLNLLSESDTAVQQIKPTGHLFNSGLVARLFLLVAVTFSTVLYLSDESAAERSSASKQSDQVDPWKPMRLFIGKWEGDSQGQPGNGKTEREYAFVLRNRFVQVSHKTVYAPQEKNPKGEAHEDPGLFSYHRASKKLRLRQFHVEGFVIHYVIQGVSEDGRTLVFTSSDIENIAAGWVARETYQFVSDDVLIETFALGGAGQGVRDLFANSRSSQTVDSLTRDFPRLPVRA